MNISKRYGSLLLLSFSGLLAFSGMSVADTIRVNVSTAGVEAEDSGPEGSALSGDGRYVVFASNADHLIEGETATLSNSYLRDITQGTTTRLSRNMAGSNPDGSTVIPRISANGRYVALYSMASDLVDNDTNNTGDIFLYDRLTNVMTLVSVGLNGESGNGQSYFRADISADGRYVVFPSVASNLVGGDNNGFKDIFLYDTHTGTTTLVSTPQGPSLSGADGESSVPKISADGRYVVFHSEARNLVAGGTVGTNVFRYDTVTGSTSFVSVSLTGGSGVRSYYPDISADGRYVVFQSYSSHLVTEDTNGEADIFIRDMMLATTTRIVPTTIVAGSEPNGGSNKPSISANGRHVAFHSLASNFVGGDTNDKQDVFVYDRATSHTIRVSVDSLGGQANDSSRTPHISDDGLKISFGSRASNLVSGDTNDKRDIFVHSIVHAIIPGDCNGDGNIDINDVICTINIVLSDGEAVNGADCDESGGDVDINDVICTINKVLG